MSKKQTENKNKKHPKLSAALRVIRIVKNIVFAVVLVFLVSVIVITITTRVSGKTPFIFGYSIQRVSSGSMKPTLKVGDIILCHQCDPLTLKKGDIITYEGTSGSFRGKLVTHRIVKSPYKDGDVYTLVTKGDDNPVEDSPITTADVLGKFEMSLDFLTPLYSFFLTPWGLLVIIALIILAFFNEIIVFVKSIFGIGYEEEPNVDEIIERYYRENAENDKVQDNAGSTGSDAELRDGMTSEENPPTEEE